MGTTTNARSAFSGFTIMLVLTMSILTAHIDQVQATDADHEELFDSIEEYEEWAADARADAESEGNSDALELIEEADSLIELARDKAESDDIDQAWEYLDDVDEILTQADEMLYGSSEVQECEPTAGEQPSEWNEVGSFAYQLQEINLQEVADTDFDLVIIDYSSDGSDEGRFTRDQIQCLQDSGTLVLAYMSIGEAEDYRWYWDESWDSDHDGNPEDGAPSWLGLSNPEWFGNYKIKYWDPDWEPIIYGYIDRLIEAGFDGMYLDIIDAYEYWGPGGESGLERVGAEQEMVDFVIDIASYARESSGNPNFGVFPQNGDALAAHPEYVDVVIGIGREDLWTLDNDPQSSTDIEEGIANLDVFNDAGKLVLVTDYATDEDIIDDFYSKALARGYVPYAAVRDLDQLIERYPPTSEPKDESETEQSGSNGGGASSDDSAGPGEAAKVTDEISVTKQDNESYILAGSPFILTTEIDGDTFTVQGIAEKTLPSAIHINPSVSLQITLDGKQHDRLQITLPKTILSNVTGIVLDDGTSSEFQVLDETDSNTTIAFELAKDTSGIDIMAETVVPEFPVGALLFGISVALVTAAMTVARRRISIV